MIRTIPCTSDVTVTATSPITHLCPHVDEVDEGTVTIEWAIDGNTIELHSLRTYLDRFRSSRISHEEVTDLLRHELSTLPGVRLVSVTSAWTTAGMEVTCSTSPTPVGATP